MARNGLLDLADRSVTELSGGERKRVHLARVVAHARTGGTAIVVSHDVNRLSRVRDRFIVMSEGRIHAEGTAAQVLTASILTAALGASVVVDGSGDALAVHLP